MQCTVCGAIIEKIVRDYQILDDVVGSFGIPHAELWECSECGHVLYPAETATRISVARKKRIDEFIRRHPIGNFVSAREAASMIGHSKQAFSKNQKIKNGFIYGTEVDKRKLFLCSSVFAFKETGDGRHSLSLQTQEVEVYIADRVGETQAESVLGEDYSEGIEADRMSSLSTAAELSYV